ncbi:hypothetical protein [Neomegalonema sp.]|uniref:hypothetical protein n=1 Tax=Neomegalonema sp. TaxID=2039713 RepID=UPI002629F106|nr:hypothetical protein [Neomegalonema sp.]MDD2868787.1 hypothetical protein [Neomegalonema sp.]
MSGYEYKTLALPRLLKGPRARRQSAADFVAGVLDSALNGEQAQGWEYMGVQEFSTPDRAGLFGRVETAEFAVLIFRRPREASAPVKRMMEMRTPAAAPVAAVPAPAQEPPAVQTARPASPISPAAPTNSPRPFPPRALAAGGMFKGGRPTSGEGEAPGAPAAPSAAPRAPRPGAPSPQNTPRLDDDFGKL